MDGAGRVGQWTPEEEVRMRNLITTLAAGAALALSVGAASAQSPFGRPGGVPMNPPAVSPYLNLQRRGTDPAINYYGIVRPQLEFRNAYRGLQQQVDLQQHQLEATDPRTGLPETGHVATFMNTGGYFLSQTGPGRTG